MRQLFIPLKKLVKSQQGMAILLVLSSITLMSLAVVDFMAASKIDYKMVIRNKERLQAYYLARSALSFSEILLKYQKEFESQLSNVPKGGEDVVKRIEPLYRMLPLSSNLFRGMLSPEEGSEKTEESKVEEEKKEDDSGSMKGLSQSVSFLSEGDAKEFLSFDGDFSAEIFEEQTKFNLNRFYGLEKEGPGAKTYNRLKRTLYSILLLPEFKSAFKNQTADAEKLTHAIADWVDQDDVFDEFDESKRGSEGGLYGGADYRVKNGKLLTLSELRLIAGMNDDVYKKLLKYVTVYGTGSQQSGDGVNVCLREDDQLLKALIYSFTHYAGCETRPLEYEKKEAYEELIGEIMAVCPTPTDMAGSLNSKLGITGVSTNPNQPAVPGQSGTLTGSGCQYGFDKLLSKENRVFTVVGTGTVGDTELRIRAVLNIDPQKSTDWKYYYYRIE